ncbi:MAG TPA: GFA family protein [Arsenophonus sp.]
MNFIVENDLCIAEKSNVSYFASTEWAARTAFCHKCGTHLFFKIFKPESDYINATLFDESKTGLLVTQLYADCKLMYYNLVEETALLTEQDILKIN